MEYAKNLMNTIAKNYILPTMIGAALTFSGCNKSEPTPNSVDNTWAIRGENHTYIRHPDPMIEDRVYFLTDHGNDGLDSAIIGDGWASTIVEKGHPQYKEVSKLYDKLIKEYLEK